MLIEGAAWGVLEVDSTRQRDFSQDTIEFLTATAALIGAFLQGHRERTERGSKTGNRRYGGAEPRRAAS